MRKSIILLTLLLGSISSFAASPLEEYFYASGKIRVVIAVVTIVLIGVFFFLFRLERRIKRLENKSR